MQNCGVERLRLAIGSTEGGAIAVEVGLSLTATVCGRQDEDLRLLLLNVGDGK
jgi:hypothetical protein